MRCAQGVQPAANIDQLSNKHDTQWQQLEAMQRQLAAQVARLEAQRGLQVEQHEQQVERLHAQQVEQTTQLDQQLQDLQSEQATLLERLQRQLTEQHAQQQESLRARDERTEVCNTTCVQAGCAALPNCSAEV